MTVSADFHMSLTGQLIAEEQVFETQAHPQALEVRKSTKIHKQSHPQQMRFSQHIVQVKKSAQEVRAQFIRLANTIKKVAQEILEIVREWLDVPYSLFMARIEKWDPVQAIQSDSKIVSDWKKHEALFLENQNAFFSVTPGQFLRDFQRGRYFLDRVQSVFENACMISVPNSDMQNTNAKLLAKVEDGGAAKQAVQVHQAVPVHSVRVHNVVEKLSHIVQCNRAWCAFLQREFAAVTKEKYAASLFGRLRYELQDLATQRLFMLSDKLLLAMFRGYENEGYIVKSGDELYDFHLKRKDHSLRFVCNKIFTIVKLATLAPVGFDGLAIEIAIDLQRFEPTKSLLEQLSGSVTGRVKETGFCVSSDAVEALLEF